jgi:hypothetical protein
MDRVVTLSNKLQEQLSQNASIDQLLVTVGMLQSELLHKKQLQPKKEAQSSVSVHIAQSANAAALAQEQAAAEPAEKTVEVLHVDEAELEAELEEIKRNAQAKNNMGTQNKPAALFENIEEIPTLAQHLPASEQAKPEILRPAEIHEMISKEQSASLNERLKQEKTELRDSLKEEPVKDLKKAIGINDRFLFINDLFRGDEVMYERSIKTINGFSIFPEAEYWIKRELKLKLGWDDRHPVVKQFDQMVRRRFL